MNRIRTWAQLLVEIKTELKIQATTVAHDDLFLAWANESLVQLAQSGKDLREARIDLQQVITLTDIIDFDTLAIAAIETVEYTSSIDNLTWELAEQKGVHYPPATEGCPTGYIVTQSYLNNNFPRYTFRFLPAFSGGLGDMVRIIGTGFLFITDDATNLTWFPYYQWIKVAIMERYNLCNYNKEDRIQLITKLKGETGAATVRGTSDDSNQENPSQSRR